MRRDARLALRLVLDEHVRPRPAATQTTAAPRFRRLGLRLGAALLALKMYGAHPFLNIVSAMLRAGASMDSVKGGGSAEEWIRSLNSNIHTGGWADRVHWAACTKLVDDIRAAGGTWTAYRKQSRKDVLRLRSLMLRGRTKDAADPVVARVLRLPNEMCWHVLKFWRATSDATGEVI